MIRGPGRKVLGESGRSEVVSMSLVKLLDRGAIVIVPSGYPPSEAIATPALLAINEYGIVTNIRSHSNRGCITVVVDDRVPAEILVSVLR